MSVFGAYSKYYNLFYKDKDYAGEVNYIQELIQKYSPGARSILDLGCGTGLHDFEFAKLGYEIIGVDISEEMLTTANSHLTSHISRFSRGSCTFLTGDIRNIRLKRTFDVVVSLFHVMSYQITNEDLQAVFDTARDHLNSGGLFIFDCWYGPAVLTDQPVVKVKRLEDDEISAIRIAEPVIHYNENFVDVNYEVLITDKLNQGIEKLRETHRMRYLFMPEIQEIMKSNGMRFEHAEEWVTGKEPGCDTWGICFTSIKHE